jgi:hypothetical protein
MLSNLEVHSLPELEHRSPTTGPLMDVGAVSAFIAGLVKPSGVGVPTVLIINLEGRFPTAAVLYELVVGLGRAIQSRSHGELALVFATPDPGLGAVIRAIAESQGLCLFLTASADALESAEPIGRLTASDFETLAILRRLGGRASVSTLAHAASIDHKAAGNRLKALDQRQLVLRVERPRREGHIYLDPRVATQSEEPSDPTSAEFGLPAALRSDVSALAAMQGREPAAVLAEAFNEFLRKHSDEMGKEHAEISKMMRAGDKKGVAAYTGRHAARRARAQTQR